MHATNHQMRKQGYLEDNGTFATQHIITEVINTKIGINPDINRYRLNSKMQMVRYRRI